MMNRKHWSYAVLSCEIRIILPSNYITASAYTHMFLLLSFSLSHIKVFTLGNNAYGQCGRKIVEDEIYRYVCSHICHIPIHIPYTYTYMYKNTPPSSR